MSLLLDQTQAPIELHGDANLLNRSCIAMQLLVCWVSALAFWEQQ